MIYTQYFVGILNKYHTIAFLGKCESKVSIQSMISQYDQSPSSSLGECWIFSFIHHMVNMGSIQKHYLCFTVSSVTLWWMEYVHFFVGNQWACHEFYNVKILCGHDMVHKLLWWNCVWDKCCIFFFNLSKQTNIWSFFRFHSNLTH